jgi:hypothetical protein
MLFSMDAWPRIADGTITTTFRTWTRPQAKAGGRYRVAGMLLEADAVTQVKVGRVTNADARRAGEADKAALLHLLGDPPADATVWRVDFHYVGRDDRAVLREVAEVDDTLIAKLDRLGPWTYAVLKLIRDNPGVVSTTLAEQHGQERFAFKQNVRKLKELGLTESLTTGYRLSPRGEAVLRARGTK